jgi:hypothetical protein
MTNNRKYMGQSYVPDINPDIDVLFRLYSSAEYSVELSTACVELGKRLDLLDDWAIYLHS